MGRIDNTPLQLSGKGEEEGFDNVLRDAGLDHGNQLLVLIQLSHTVHAGPYFYARTNVAIITRIFYSTEDAEVGPQVVLVASYVVPILDRRTRVVVPDR